MQRKKKALTVEHTTESRDSSKLRSSEHYREIHIERLVESMKRFFVDNPDAKEIQEFYHAHDIPKSTYYDLVERWPTFKVGHETLKERLGGRLLSRSIEYKYNWNPVKWIIGNYSPEYAKAKEDEAMLAARARESVNATDGPQIVVIEKFPDSPIVPEKKQ